MCNSRFTTIAHEIQTYWLLFRNLIPYVYKCQRNKCFWGYKTVTCIQVAESRTEPPVVELYRLLWRKVISKANATVDLLEPYVQRLVRGGCAAVDVHIKTALAVDYKRKDDSIYRCWLLVNSCNRLTNQVMFLLAKRVP